MHQLYFKVDSYKMKYLSAGEFCLDSHIFLTNFYDNFMANLPPVTDILALIQNSPAGRQVYMRQQRLKRLKLIIF